MSGFSAEWLALREPADAAARSVHLTRTLSATLGSRGDLHVLDLGAGTGSNVRFLAEYLPARQRWLLVDHDADLLGQVRGHMESWGSARGYAVTRDADDVLVRGPNMECRLTTRQLDLARCVGEPTLFDLSADLSAVAPNAKAEAPNAQAEGRTIVTASALLDLVSERWLEALVQRCADQRASVLFALTYDGRIAYAPSEPEDGMVRDFVNQHQRTDKGFGVALGPDAVSIARAAFARAGYDVQCDASDWVLTPSLAALQRQLIDGWASAATTMAPKHAEVIRRWRLRRLTHVDADRSHAIVGHMDLMGWMKR